MMVLSFLSLQLQGEEHVLLLKCRKGGGEGVKKAKLGLDRFDFKVSLSLGLRFYSYLTYPFLHFSFIFWLKIFKILMRAFNLSITLKLILIFIVILFVCLDVCFFVCIRKTPKLQNRWGLVFYVGPHLTTENDWILKKSTLTKFDFWKFWKSTKFFLKSTK